MAKKLYFPHAFTLGLGPGKAAQIKAGDAIKIGDDDLAAMLERRFGATENVPKGIEEVRIEHRLMGDDAAAKISHHLVKERMQKSQTEILAEAIRELAAAQGGLQPRQAEMLTAAIRDLAAAHGGTKA